MIVPLLIALVVLTVIYAIVSVWSRSVRRERLEEEWDRDQPTPDRDAFIDAGLKDYDRSFRRKLILGVYVVPMVLVVFLIYAVNYM